MPVGLVVALEKADRVEGLVELVVRVLLALHVVDQLFVLRVGVVKIVA